MRLFLDLNDKAHNNLVKEGLQYQDIYDTIELIVNQLGACQELLKIRPVFKRHQENFDQTLKVFVWLYDWFN